MSERGYKGKMLRILRAGELLAAVRAKSVSHSKVPIDCSDEEKSGWRHLDKKADSRSVELSIDGIATAENYRLLEDWRGSSFSDIAILHPNGTLEYAADGAFLSSLSFEGTHDSAVIFRAAFTFSGLITFVERMLLTSHSYPIELIDSLVSAVTFLRQAPTSVDIEDVLSAVTFIEGQLTTKLHPYDEYAPEEMESSIAFVEGELASKLISLGAALTEETESAVSFIEGELRVALVSYDNYVAEELESSITFIGGSLE